MLEAPAIRIAVALIVDRLGRVLLVRKRGTALFLQPGGKIEPGETALDALRRELFEEIGIEPDGTLFRYLGSFSAMAAHEPGHPVEAEAFRLDFDGEIVVRAEIEEARWVDPAAPAVELAALTRDAILPLAVRSRTPCHRPA